MGVWGRAWPRDSGTWCVLGRAGESAFFLSVFIPEEYYPGRFETKQAFRRVDHALRQLQENSKLVELALNAEDVERIHASGKMAAVLDLRVVTTGSGIWGFAGFVSGWAVGLAQLSAHNWEPALTPIVLLAGAMEGAYCAWAGCDPGDEPVGDGDQCIPLRR